MNIFRTAFVVAISVGVLTSRLQLASAHEGHEHDEAAVKVEKKIADALSNLSAEDQRKAAAQRFCPMMTHSRLGAMGTPVKVDVAGESVFVCCKGCAKGAIAGGHKTLKTAKKLTETSATLAKLSPEERTAAEEQKYCAVASSSFLGSMGAPIKLTLDGKPVYLCCDGCSAKAKSNPSATLAKVEELKKAGKNDGHDHHEHGEHAEHHEKK